MGYSNYYIQGRALGGTEWARLRSVVTQLVEAFGVDSIEWSMGEHILRLNGVGENACEDLVIHRLNLCRHDKAKVMRDFSSKWLKSMEKHYTDGRMVLEDEHIAELRRSCDIGTDEAPRYKNGVKTWREPYDDVVKAVLTAMHALIPGSLAYVVSDTSIAHVDLDDGEVEWTSAVALAKRVLLPSHVHVVNLGRAVPTRRWDKVRRAAFTVMPALRACQARAAARAYAPEGGGAATAKRSFAALLAAQEDEQAA